MRVRLVRDNLDEISVLVLQLDFLALCLEQSNSEYNSYMSECSWESWIRSQALNKQLAPSRFGKIKMLLLTQNSLHYYCK